MMKCRVVPCLMLILVSVFAAGAGKSVDTDKSSSSGDWRNEQWVVEDFTRAMGGGPDWGPAVGVGTDVESMAQDNKGNIFLVAGRGDRSDGNQFVDIVTSDGIRLHLAGTGALGYRDGSAKTAEFRMGLGSYYEFTNIGADDRGNVFVPDNGNKCVRRIFKNAEGRWWVETYAGGGGRELKPGESCTPREAKIGGNLHVAVAPDGTVTVGGAARVWRITQDGKKIICLGDWPAPAEKRMNHCGAGADRHGNAFFASRTPDLVFRVSPTGEIVHIIGVENKTGERMQTPDGPPLKMKYDTPSSMFVDPDGACVYLNGGDEYDIRRVPTDMKTTSAMLLVNGRWYVSPDMPSYGESIFDPKLTGKLTVLMCSPLVGVDREGNLYGTAGRNPLAVAQFLAEKRLL